MAFTHCHQGIFAIDTISILDSLLLSTKNVLRYLVSAIASANLLSFLARIVLYLRYLKDDTKKFLLPVEI